MSVGSLVSSGPLLLAIPVAAAAGAVTFLSPCVLPLVPGYLSYITGMSGASVVTGDAPSAGSRTDAGAESASAGTLTASTPGGDDGDGGRRPGAGPAAARSQPPHRGARCRALRRWASRLSSRSTARRSAGSAQRCTPTSRA